MSKPKILFADDSDTIRQVFEFAFENEEVKVTLASNGQEAFEKAKELRPDMVIADVNMPEVDGFELCRLIKDDSSLSSIPVYLLSSSLEEFDEERGQTVGADGNFNKPFKAEEMLDKVRGVIEEFNNPKSVAQKEDSFDEIDISIDSILEDIEKTVEKETATDNPRLDEVESAVSAALASSHLLDLGAEAKVETEPDEADDLAVEVISGDDASLKTDFEDMEPLAEDADIADEVAIDNISETEFNVAGSAEPDEFAPSEIVEGSLVSQEDDDSEVTDEKRDTLLTVASEEDDSGAPDVGTIHAEGDMESEIGAIPDSQVAKNVQAKAKQEPDETVADVLGDLNGRGIDETINEAIREAVAEKLKSSEVEKLLASLVQSAMDDMKPAMLAMLKKVAQDMTLDVAEDMVKQTIDQIKNEK